MGLRKRLREHLHTMLPIPAPECALQDGMQNSFAALIAQFDGVFPYRQMNTACFSSD